MRILQGLWQRAVSPRAGFRLRVAEAPTLGPSLGRLLLLRSPLAFISSVLGYWSLRSTFQGLYGLEGDTGALLLRYLPPSVSLEDVRSALSELPRFPEWGRVWPWLLLGAPLGVLGLWLHDAVWDHGCLWMLGGLKAKQGFRPTLVAESEALSVGSIGAAVGLLGAVPYLGCGLSLPLALVACWFWILRGFALAAWHDCPLWKGICATVLHAVLVVCCLGGLVGFCVFALTVAVA